MTDTKPKASGHAHGEDRSPSAYPTYRDGPVPPHTATTTKPTDVDLRKQRRTFAWPMLSGLAAALIVGVALVVWGSVQLADEEAPPLDPARTGSIEGPEQSGSQATSGAKEPTVSPEPGAIDVPG